MVGHKFNEIQDDSVRLGSKDGRITETSSNKARQT